MSETIVRSKHETEWITISKDEYESMKSTLEILSNPKLRDEILEGKKQVKEGKVRSLKDIAKEVGLKFDI